MQRSWMAYISAGLGGAALLGVLGFHFPTLLTSRDFRAVYTEGFARNLLLLALVVAFAGVCFAALAVFLGGATIEVDHIRDTPFSLGLDWFVISLFFSALIFIP